MTNLRQTEGTQTAGAAETHTCGPPLVGSFSPGDAMPGQSHGLMEVPVWARRVVALSEEWGSRWCWPDAARALESSTRVMALMDPGVVIEGLRRFGDQTSNLPDDDHVRSLWFPSSAYEVEDDGPQEHSDGSGVLQAIGQFLPKTEIDDSVREAASAVDEFAIRLVLGELARHDRDGFVVERVSGHVSPEDPSWKQVVFHLRPEGGVGSEGWLRLLDLSAGIIDSLLGAYPEKADILASQFSFEF